MTRAEFREKWAADQITWDNIDDCAKEWGLFNQPRCAPMFTVRHLVLLAADVPHAEEYSPHYLEALECQDCYY